MSAMRRAGPILALIVLALVLRIAYFASYGDHPEFREPMLDAEWFHDQAVALLGGDWLSEEAAFRGPFYPLFLAGIYRIAGPDPAAARFVQLLLGGATVLLLVFLGRGIYGGTVGFLAGLLGALAWIVVYFEGELLIESVLPLLAALVLLAFLRADRTRTARDALLAGAAIGLFAAARPNILLFLPAALLWLALRGRRGAFFVLIGMIFVLAPVVLRNRAATGEWVFVSTQGGLNFYIGNHREADGRHAVFPGLASWRNDDIVRQTAARLGRVPSENEISRYWFREALRTIAGDPFLFAAGLVRKTGYLLSAYEIGNNRDIALYRRANGVLSLPLVSLAVLLPLALVGILFDRRRNRGANLLLLFLLFYGLSVVLFFVCARFRLPMVVPLIVLAARGLDVVGRRAFERSWRTLAAPVLVLAAAHAGTSIDWFGLGVAAEGQEAFHRGNVNARLGRTEEAIESYREAARKIPRFAAVRYHLGVVLLGEGREEEGFAELLQAMELDPVNPRVPVSLGEHLEARGDKEGAEALYRRSLAIDPYFPDAHIDLGGLLAETGRVEEAETFLRRAIMLAPKDPVALLNLGKLLASTGRDAEAAPLLRRASEIAPERRDVWFEWGNLLFREGRLAESAGAFREAARLDPRDIPSRMNLALALRSMGNREGAIAALREVLAVDPGNETARKRIADLASGT
ncbi:MAG: tetratricopeptide repeat protein [Candidatus Eisenbacteria bacterium]|nr:tetratricopeptide repeat protein [Candidatus Eisenbacteria bacterium]